MQEPLTSIISIGKHAIADPKDLKGKTVGTAGIPYQSAYLKTILERAGVDPSSVKEVNVGFNLVPAMLTKKVDATLGAFWNYEGVQLRLDKQRPKIIRIENVGVPTYHELVIVARQQDLAKGGERVRRFMRALGQGQAALRSDPEAGVEPLLKANPDLQRDLQLESVKATLPAFFPPTGQAVRLEGAGRVDALRRLDVLQQAAQPPAQRGARADRTSSCPGRGWPARTRAAASGRDSPAGESIAFTGGPALRSALVIRIEMKDDDLARRLSYAASTVSAHLDVLSRAGLVERHRVRRSVFYRLNDTGRAFVVLLTDIPAALSA